MKSAVQDTTILRVLTSIAEELFRCGVSGEGIHLAVYRCAETLPESNVFMSFGLALERKQIPRFVGNVSS
jgi:hypothetical protein